MKILSEYITGLKSFKGFAGDIVSHKIFDATPPAWASPNTFPCFKNDLSHLLAGLGIKKLYTHQARAISLIIDKCHTVIATPTASGKSLVYNLPVMDALISDPKAHALYLFPLKALARDQRSVAKRGSQSDTTRRIVPLHQEVARRRAPATP